jgi:hypothetical protein
VTSNDLTVDQAARLSEHLGAHLGYLVRLTDRLDHLRFRPDDPLYRKAWDARHAVQALFMEAHYASCKSGVGRVEKPNV